MEGPFLWAQSWWMHVMIGTTVNLMQYCVYYLNEGEDYPNENLMFIIKMKIFLCYCISSSYFVFSIQNVHANLPYPPRDNQGGTRRFYKILLLWLQFFLPHVRLFFWLQRKSRKHRRKRFKCHAWRFSILLVDFCAMLKFFSIILVAFYMMIEKKTQVW